MSEIGKLKVSVSGDVTELEHDVESAADSSKKSFGSVGDYLKQGFFNKIGAGALSAIGGVATGATSLAKDAVNAISEIQGSVDSADFVFGESLPQIREWAAGASQSMGLTSGAALDFASNFGVVLEGLGKSQAEAAEESMKITQRAADISASNGKSQEEVMNALTAVAKGKYKKALDTLGVSIDDNALQQYALSQGIQTSVKDMDKAQESALALDYVLAQTQNTAGGFADDLNSDQIGPAIENVATSWQNVLASLNDPDALSAAITAFVASISHAADNILALLPDLIKGALQLITELLPQLGTLIQEQLPNIIKLITDALPVILQALVGIFVAIVNALPSIIEILIAALINLIPVLLQAAVQLFLALVNAIPIIITKLVEALPMLITALVTALIQAQPQILAGSIQLFSALLQAIPIILSTLLTLLPTVISGVVDFLKANGPQILQQFGASIQSSVGDVDWGGILRQAGKAMIEGLIAGIKLLIPNVVDIIKDMGGDILDGFLDFFDIHSPSRLMRDMVGKNLGLGVGEGLTGSMTYVSQDIHDFNSSVSGELSAALEADSLNTASSGGNIIVQQTVDSPKTMLDVQLNTQKGVKLGKDLKGGK